MKFCLVMGKEQHMDMQSCMVMGEDHHIVINIFENTYGGNEPFKGMYNREPI